MKYLGVTAAAFLASAIAADAADMAVKAPYLKAPVVSVYDWTGFYFGANAGIGVGRNKTELVGLGGTSFNTSHLAPHGAIGGGQVGYNWQTGSVFGPLVLGVEADIQGAAMRDDFTNFGLGQATAYDQRLDWFGTVRGRIGRADGPVFSYATAGYAYGSVRTTLNQAGTASPISAIAFIMAGPMAAASRLRLAATGAPRSRRSMSISATSAMCSRPAARPSAPISASASIASA